MSNSLTEDFNKFVEIISLNSKEEEDIKSKHNSLTNMIIADPPKGYNILKTRLSGSYAKHTVLNEYNVDKLPDVDIITIIDFCDKSVDEINADFLNYFEDKKGKVTSNIRQQSNSIGIIYSNISVDMVIGILKDDKLKICSNKKHDWISSNALIHIGYMIKKNKEYEGFSYYSLMKLFKYLNKEQLNNKLKSYTLEQLIHKCCPIPTVGLRLYQAFSKTLDNIKEISSITEIRDCCDEDKDGYDEKDVLIFDSFKEEIANYSDLAKEALDGNRKKWEEIFGDRFPCQPNEIVKDEAKYDKSHTPWCYK
mgnify:FL=1